MGLKKTSKKALEREVKVKKEMATPVIRRKVVAGVIDLTGDEDTADSKAGMSSPYTSVSATESQLTSIMLDHFIPSSGDEYTSPAKSSTSDPTKAKQNTLFHKLPGELRNRIYHYTCLKSVRIQLHAYKEPALSLAISDFSPEVQSVVLSQNQLEATVHSTFVCRETDDSYSRRADRGDRYGAGNLAIPADSWLWKVDPRLVKIRNIGLRIDEMGGFPLGDFFMNVKKVKLDKDNKDLKIGKFGQRVKNADGNLWEVSAAFKTKGTFTSRYTRQAMEPMAELARARVNKIVANGGPYWNGFSWAELQDVAKSFADLKTAKGKVWTKKVKDVNGKEKKVVECLLEDEELVDGRD